MKIKSVGFPRMYKETNERRDFLPSLFKKLSKYKDIEVHIEFGYGSGMGFREDDYKSAYPNIKFSSHEEIYQCDMIVVLRAPEKHEIQMMKEGSILFSMLHYETRPVRNQLLLSKGIKCFSMDSLTDDKNNRIFVNYSGTSKSGVKIAFHELKKRMEDFYSETRRPINIAIIGMGPVGLNAAKAFEEFSDHEFYYKNEKVPGLIVKLITRSITKNLKLLEEIIKDTDILVDASKRSDPTKIIVPNRLLSLMPEYSVILDLCVDPYITDTNPIQVKGIEGIPTGTLDKYVIETDDEIYSMIPKQIESSNRRVVVSSNAWPGIDPEECMEIYGEQLISFMHILLNKNLTELSIESDELFERALVRSTLDYYLNYK